MEKRKKLPLPAGSASGRRNRKAALGAIALCAVLIGLGLYYILSQSGDVTSAKAFISGSPVEIKALAAGRVEYIARAGQPVSAGEAVLKINSAEFEKAAKEAEAVVSEKAGAVPQRSRNLMLRYLGIPQSEAELAEMVGKAMEAEKTLKATFAEAGERRATFALELRRLELKRERLPEEEARMEAMRVEEDLLRQSLKEAEKRFESASLERAATERQLQNKRDLARALRALPAPQRMQLQALEKEFYKMYEAERQIALASVTSPKSGRVMYTAMVMGDSAQPGDSALYILPDGQDDIWVTAYFNPRAAQKMQLGAPCRLSIEGLDGESFDGIVAERLPYAEQGQNSDVPFKVRFQNLDNTRLVGINPGRGVSVALKK